MKTRIIIIFALIWFISYGQDHGAFAQTAKVDSTFKRHSIGSTLFLLGNIGDSVRLHASELRIPAHPKR